MSGSFVWADSLKYDGLSLAVAPDDVVRWAFYGPAASISAATPTYTATGEVTDPAASPALPAGGLTLSGRSLLFSGGAAWMTWTAPDVTPSVDFTWQKILLYNQTRNRALWFLDAETPQTWSAGQPMRLFVLPAGVVGLLSIS